MSVLTQSAGLELLDSCPAGDCKLDEGRAHIGLPLYQTPQLEGLAARRCLLGFTGAPGTEVVGRQPSFEDFWKVLSITWRAY